MMQAFYYFDISLALSHAYHLKALGYKATVGKDNGAVKYHVRILGTMEPPMPMERTPNAELVAVMQED